MNGLETCGILFEGYLGSIRKTEDGRPHRGLRPLKGIPESVSNEYGSDATPVKNKASLVLYSCCEIFVAAQYIEERQMLIEMLSLHQFLGDFR
jgi:hypothetical protein